MSKYHDEFAAGGRKHRLIVALHPSITRPPAEDDNPTPEIRGTNNTQGDMKCLQFELQPRGRTCPPPRSRSGRRSPLPRATPPGCFPTRSIPTAPARTAWDPPDQFAVRQEQGDWFNALEFVIEGRGGGTSALRYVHCGIFVRGLGHSERGHPAAHRLLPAHPRRVPGALQRAHRHLHRRCAPGHPRTAHVGDTRRLPAPPAGPRTRRAGQRR